MNRKICLILALVLALTLAGCGGKSEKANVETSVSQTEAAVTEPQKPARPGQTELEFWGEGMKYPAPATLHAGQGYSVYIPNEGWKLTQTQNEWGWDDTWVSDYNGAVEMKVAFYSGATEADLQTAVTPTPITQTENGYWLMERREADCEIIRLYPEEAGVYALFMRYPAEAAEGFGMQMQTIMDTFEVTQ